MCSVIFFYRKEWSKEFALNFDPINEDPDFLKRVITGDESWIYGYDV